MSLETNGDDDRLLEVYNQKLIALAARADAPRHLTAPDAKARAISPICGSEVEIELQVQGDKIIALGFTVEACALTKAVVGVLQTAIIGKTRQDVTTAGSEMRAMLTDGADGPAGDWQELRVLSPVRDYKARHNSILLPFEAVDKVFEMLKK